MLKLKPSKTLKVLKLLCELIFNILIMLLFAFMSICVILQINPVILFQ